MTENELFLSENTEFFNKITEREKHYLMQGVRDKVFEKGQAVHISGGPCLGVLMVKKGRLRVYLLSDEGREITLYYIEKGETCILSASCVLSQISFEVFIDADSDTQVLQINSEIFSELQKQNVYVENYALKVTADRFNDVMWALNHLLFLSIDKRLSMFLYDETVRSQSDTVMLTHEQIAKALGTAREVVTRMLKQFVIEGLVELSRSKIEIIDKKRLIQRFS